MPCQQAPESARCVPDPLLLGVGSGDETIVHYASALNNAICKSE
jgi:hypothetical protein